MVPEDIQDEDDREAEDEVHGRGGLIDQHDWRKYLLAKDTHRGFYEGPDWVPHNLWSALSHVGAAKRLVESAGAKELWMLIEATYEHPNSIATTLPMQLDFVREQWLRLSKRTPAEHRDHYQALKAKAESLAIEVDRLESLEDLLTGEKYDFMRLLNEDERSDIRRWIWRHNLVLRNSAALGVKGEALGYGACDIAGNVSGPVHWDQYTELDKSALPPRSDADIDAWATFNLLLGDEDGFSGIVPSISNMLRRLAAHLGEQSELPPLQRPAFANAERNFVTRHICRYFKDSYGLVSPAIVARVISMFFPQGITDNEVSKIVASIAPSDAAVRQELVAEVEAFWPQYRMNPRLVELVERGSNDDLRKLLFSGEINRLFTGIESISDPESSPSNQA